MYLQGKEDAYLDFDVKAHGGFKIKIYDLNEQSTRYEMSSVFRAMATAEASATTLRAGVTGVAGTLSA